MPNKNYFNKHEEYLAYYRKYRAINREKLRAYKREYNKKWRKENGYHNEYKWAENNPEKAKTEKIFRYAIKTKLIEKKPCAICDATQKIHAHHPDYSKPLEVIWLCPLHHKEIHMKPIWTNWAKVEKKITKGKNNV